MLKNHDPAKSRTVGVIPIKRPFERTSSQGRRWCDATVGPSRGLVGAKIALRKRTGRRNGGRSLNIGPWLAFAGVGATRGSQGAKTGSYRLFLLRLVLPQPIGSVSSDSDATRAGLLTRDLLGPGHGRRLPQSSLMDAGPCSMSTPPWRTALYRRRYPTPLEALS
jgi:hypothetical protein